MIVIVIKESPNNPSITKKKFLCIHCGKLISYYSIAPVLCEGEKCRRRIPNMQALIQMPSARISWHKGTTDLLCSL